MTWLPSGLRKASTLYFRVWIGLHDLGVVQVHVELVGTAMGGEGVARSGVDRLALCRLVEAEDYLALRGNIT